MSHRRRELLDYAGVVCGLVGVLLLVYHATTFAVVGGIALVGAAYYLLVDTRFRQPPHRKDHTS
jgi:hypothetical protein